MPEPRFQLQMRVNGRLRFASRPTADRGALAEQSSIVMAVLAGLHPEWRLWPYSYELLPPNGRFHHGGIEVIACEATVDSTDRLMAEASR